MFFSERSLSLGEGYRIFAGGIPDIEDVKLNDGAEARDIDAFEAAIIKRLSLVLRRERINEGGVEFYCTRIPSQFDSSSHVSPSALFWRC